LIAVCSQCGEWIGYPFLFGTWQRMDGGDWQVIGILAVLMLGIGIGLAKAYQSPRPQVVATFDYAYLIFAAFWGYVFFGEVPDGWAMSGIVLIAGAGFIVLSTRSRNTAPRDDK
jgi:drug/metabolite transporter (DMT)-like permease